jgi:amino acid transporter
MSAQLAAARLLYGMGRDGALSRRFFSALNPRTGIPQNNVLFVGAIALIGAFTLSYQMGAELLNFGAFIAFMGVNAAAFVHYWLRGERKLTYFLPPIAGFVICLYIWLNLNTPAKIAGACWLIVGAVFAAWKTNGFRRPIAFSEPPPE